MSDGFYPTRRFGFASVNGRFGGKAGIAVDGMERPLWGEAV